MPRDISWTHDASGVKLTPTFFINGRRYDGPWDETSLSEAMLGTLGHRVRAAALDFASWSPSAGVLLFLATLLALAVSNSPLGPAFTALWHRKFAFSLDEWRFGLSLLHWVNDGLLTIFFLVVGILLWACILASGLHATLAGVLPHPSIPSPVPGTRA